MRTPRGFVKQKPMPNTITSSTSTSTLSSDGSCSSNSQELVGESIAAIGELAQRAAKASLASLTHFLSGPVVHNQESQQKEKEKDEVVEKEVKQRVKRKGVISTGSLGNNSGSNKRHCVEGATASSNALSVVTSVTTASDSAATATLSAAPASCTAAPAPEASVTTAAQLLYSECPTLSLPVFVPSPKTITFIDVKQNRWAEDQSKLKYRPYLGDDDTTRFDISDFEQRPGEVTAALGGEVLEVMVRLLVDKFEFDPSVRARLSLSPLPLSASASSSLSSSSSLFSSPLRKSPAQHRASLTKSREKKRKRRGSISSSGGYNRIRSGSSGSSGNSDAVSDDEEDSEDDEKEEDQ